MPSESGQLPFRRALMATICKKFGAQRENVVKKLQENVEKRLKFEANWFQDMELQHVQQNGVTVYAFETVKEMMDNWRMPSWQLLVSFCIFIQYFSCDLARKIHAN